MKRAIISLLLPLISTALFGQSHKIFSSINDALLDSVNVRSLSLVRDSNIKELPLDILKLKNLTEIDLESLPNLDFSKAIVLLGNLPHLKKIFISGCNITSTEAKINRFLMLEEISLVETDLKELPQEIGDMKSLKQINLSGNPDLNFKTAFHLLSNLPNLRMLQIEDCKLSTLPDELTELGMLDTLWLDNNGLTDIPKSLRKLTQLKSLRLFNNDIKNIILRHGDLTSLNDIDLCYNKFIVFPTSLSVLPRLEKIVMWSNPLKYIPKEIGRFNGLEILIVDNSELYQLPKEMQSLKSLKELGLRGNYFTAKSIKPVFKLRELRKLGIRDNKIEYISPEISQLMKLEDIDMSGNPLNNLPVEFSVLKNLQQIGLGDLRNFQWSNTFRILANLPRLDAVRMYRMKLNKMPEGFEKLTQVKTFWLNQNNFDNNEKARLEKLHPAAKLSFN